MSRTYRSQFSRLLHQRLDLEPYPEWEEAFFVLKKLIFKQAFWAFLQRFLHNLTPIFITLCLLGASCGKSNFAFFIAPKKAFWSFLQLFFKNDVTYQTTIEFHGEFDGLVQKKCDAPP